MIKSFDFKLVEEGFMKFVVLLVLCLFVSLAFATDNNGDNPSGPSAQIETQGTDAVSLTVVNSFAPGRQVLGLDIYHGVTSNSILGVCKNDLEVQAYLIDGTLAGVLTLDPANTGCFGFAWNDESDTPIYHSNDWYDADIYTTEDFGVSWTTSANPAGDNGRGMDFDGTDYWMVDKDGSSAWRFQPGVAAEEVSIPGVSGMLSGLTTFPYGSNLGIAIAVYNINILYFFEWDGSSLSSLGSATCPGTSIYDSLGLAYNPATGNMHWSYSAIGGAYHVVEFSFDITSLERSSWGSIKSSF